MSISRRVAIVRSLVFVCCCLAASLPRQAAGAAGADEWSNYGHDPGNMRYSPLKQIAPANVAALAPVWTFHMRPASMDVAAANVQAGPPDRFRPNSRFIGSEMTPLVVKGLMFLATPYRRVVALDATSGKQVWAYDLPGSDAPASRGVSYWSGERGAKPRVIVSTRNGNVIALDAATGQPIGENEGIVVSPFGTLRTRHATEFSCPEHERFLQQPTLFQVLN